MLFLIKKLIHKKRRWLLSPFNANLSIGKNFKCGRGCTVSRKNKIKIGDNFFMGHYCHLASDLDISDDVLFASHVSCVGGDHKIDHIYTAINKAGRAEFKTTVIEKNVWVGHGAIIMHGVRLHQGCVIAAGSVVTKDVPENAVVGGNPAKIIRYRKLKPSLK